MSDHPHNTEPTVTGILSIMQSSGLTLTEAATLLGFNWTDLPNVNPFDSATALTSEQATRLQLMSEILNALPNLHDERTAPGWLHRPIAGLPFFGQTPLHFMLSEGLRALRFIHRRLLAAQNGIFTSTPEARRLASTLPQPEIDLEP